jgi:hypothetical protein
MSTAGQPGTEPAKASEAASSLVRCWFDLTSDEQKAVVMILAIFLLGLTVRIWHLQTERHPASKPVAESGIPANKAK